MLRSAIAKKSLLVHTILGLIIVKVSAISATKSFSDFKIKLKIGKSKVRAKSKNEAKYIFG
jgi:hypothetical protein